MCFKLFTQQDWIKWYESQQQELDIGETTITVPKGQDVTNPPTKITEIFSAADSLFVKRSNIQGFGVFAKTFISAGVRLSEYHGERIRPSVGDIRQDANDKNGVQDYMFTLDASNILDATTKGSIARFFNHSCDVCSHNHL